MCYDGTVKMHVDSSFSDFVLSMVLATEFFDNILFNFRYVQSCLVVNLGRYLPYFCIGEKNCQGTKGLNVINA